MWRLQPCYDSLPPTFGTAWWAITTMLRCCWLGHAGTEYLPEFDGDMQWRSCRRCGQTWEWETATASGEAAPPTTGGE